MADHQSVVETPSPPPHVVVVGGGFAGLYATRALADLPVRVTVVDRRNHHLFSPLLYQVATAVLSAADIASPIRAILRRQRNVSVLLAEVTAVDLAGRKVVTADAGGQGAGGRSAGGQSALPYDYLILAAGTRHAYFGHDEWEPIAPGLKSLEDALTIRRRILLAFEEAEKADDLARRDELLTFAVVGAGPTGVELAGAIAEIARYAIARDFDRIDPTKARVVLIEAGPRILPTFPEKLGRKADEALRRLGVEVRTGAAVTDLAPGVVRMGEETLSAGTVLWAAGVVAAPVAHTLGVPLDRVGRVLVEPDLSLPGHPEAFVVGDLTAMSDAKGRPLPGLAPVATQQGRWAAQNIGRRLAGQATLPFRYTDRGTMATIGRNSAVANIRGVKLWGFPAWLAWAGIHILNLIGYRNRFVVGAQWLWSYVTLQRGARLITETAPLTGRRDEG